MRDTTARRISIEEAARLIYRTSSPSPLHISKIRYKIASRALEGNLEDNWASAESVAAYLAAKAANQLAPGGANRGAPGRPTGTPAARRGMAQDRAGRRDGAAAALLPRGAAPRPLGKAEEVRGVYRDLLRDYFAAVIARRRVAHRSQRFEHAVTVGQVLLIVLPFALFVVSYRSIAAPPAEQSIVEEHIAQANENYRIVRWFPPQPNPDGQGTMMRVEYRYKSQGGKWVQTDRRYSVVGDQVTELGNSADD